MNDLDINLLKKEEFTKKQLDAMLKAVEKRLKIREEELDMWEAFELMHKQDGSIEWLKRQYYTHF